MIKKKISIFILLTVIGAVVLAIMLWAKTADHDVVNDEYLTKAIRADYPGFVGQERELSSSMGRLMREYKSSDEKQRIDGYRNWGQDRAADELKREREWNDIGVTPCLKFGIGSKPQLCIEHVGSETVPINSPVAYRLRWRNLPSGAYIRVWSRNAASAGQRWKYMGAYGAIEVQSFGGSPDGDQQLKWDGRSVACAPVDAPMMCDSGEVGRYVLRAAIMTGTDPFRPGWPERNPFPVIRFAQSETMPFTLDGAPQPVSVPGRYREYRHRREIIDAIGKALPMGGNADKLVDRLGAWRARLMHYCAKLPLDQPLAGSLDVCFSRFHRDANGIALVPGDITASGDARLAHGIMSSKEAVSKATSYAIGMTEKQATYPAYPGEVDMVRKLYPDPKKYDGAYQDLRYAARDAGLSYVEVNQPWPSFRYDAKGSWWLIQLGLWIQTIDGPRVKDWGNITLRVEHIGDVCRIQATGKFEGNGADLRETYSGCLPGSQQSI